MLIVVVWVWVFRVWIFWREWLVVEMEGGEWVEGFTSCVRIVGCDGDIAFWATERWTTEDKEARSSSIHSEPSSRCAKPSSGSW